MTLDVLNGPLLSFPNPPGGGNTLATIANPSSTPNINARLNAAGALFQGFWSPAWNVAGMSLFGPLTITNTADPLEYLTFPLTITFQGFTRNNPVVVPSATLSYFIPSNATLPV